MVALSVTLSDLWPRFHGNDIFWNQISWWSWNDQVHGMWYLFLQCSDTVGWATGRTSGFVGSHDSTAALRILYLQLSPLPPSSRSSNKIQNGDILVPANPGPPGKWPLKWTERKFYYICTHLCTLHKQSCIQSSLYMMNCALKGHDSSAVLTCSGFQIPGTANDSSTSAPHNSFTSTGPAELFDCPVHNEVTQHFRLWWFNCQ